MLSGREALIIVDAPPEVPIVSPAEVGTVAGILEEPTELLAAAELAAEMLSIGETISVTELIEVAAEPPTTEEAANETAVEVVKALFLSEAMSLAEKLAAAEEVAGLDIDSGTDVLIEDKTSVGTLASTLDASTLVAVPELVALSLDATKMAVLSLPLDEVSILSVLVGSRTETIELKLDKIFQPVLVAEPTTEVGELGAKDELESMIFTVEGAIDSDSITLRALTD